MADVFRVIALDLDGTLLNSDKKLTDGNLAALKKAAAAGIEIVPTTGRFFGGMPEEIRRLPFIRYAITVNGASVVDTLTGQVIYKAEIPWRQAIEIISMLEDHPVIYDCYQGEEAFMPAALKKRIDSIVVNPHYRHMIRELRQSVPDLKRFLAERRMDVQKVQFFTNLPELRLRMMETLPEILEDVCVSSSVSDNVEINQTHANKGEALLALGAHLGIKRERILAFGDGINDIPMLKAAGMGIAMANACNEAKAVADHITLSCDEDGVARGIERFCFGA